MPSLRADTAACSGTDRLSFAGGGEPCPSLLSLPIAAGAVAADVSDIVETDFARAIDAAESIWGRDK